MAMGPEHGGTFHYLDAGAGSGGRALSYSLYPGTGRSGGRLPIAAPNRRGVRLCVHVYRPGVIDQTNADDIAAAARLWIWPGLSLDAESAIGPALHRYDQRDSGWNYG